MKRYATFVMLASLSMAVTVQAGEDVEDHPGYFDFGEVATYANGGESVEIYLEQPLLSLAKAFVEGDEPELAELLGELLLVRVNAFSIDPEQEKDLQDHVAAVTKKLADQNWARIVRVKQADEHVDIYIKMQNDKALAGLVVMATEANDDADGNEAVFVNIVGTFAFDKLGQLGAHFDIPHLGDLEGLAEMGKAYQGDGGDDSNVVVEEEENTIVVE